MRLELIRIEEMYVSRRAVLEKSKNAEITEALKNIKEGDIVDNAIVKLPRIGVYFRH